MAPPQSSRFPLWPLSLVIYRSCQFCTSSTLKYRIGLQGARDYIASLGDLDTEAGFCADTQETYGTGVFAGLLKTIQSRPNSSNMVQNDSYKPKLMIESTPRSLMFLRLFSTKISVTIELGLTTLTLHITTVPVEHRANSTTYYEESTRCNEIMVCVLT